IVTASTRAGLIYLQDATGAAEVHVRRDDPGFNSAVRAAGTGELKPGDILNVVGYARSERLAPLVEDASIQRVRPAQPPAPLATNGQLVSEGAHNAQLVEMEAILVDVVASSSERVLVLQSGSVSFKAYDLSRSLAGLEPGSRLRIRGICRREGEHGSRTVS